jgi:hypothetical protein
MNTRPVQILLQTTTPAEPNSWSIDSLSLLRQQLETVRVQGQPTIVTARNREVSSSGSDPVLLGIDRSDFDELWLFALDVLTARDHQDMGASLCSLGGVGAANHFHSKNPEPEASRQQVDDRETTAISWPNYHSGRNGDFQRIAAVEPVHPLLRDPENPNRILEFFPSHPHEGAVSAPPGDRSARAIAVGYSVSSGRPFNLVVAFESSRDGDGNALGRAAAHSSFHHFADYNWDTRKGAPSFVMELEGTGMVSNPRAAADIRAYVANLAGWIAPNRQTASSS